MFIERVMWLPELVHGNFWESNRILVNLHAGNRAGSTTHSCQMQYCWASRISTDGLYTTYQSEEAFQVNVRDKGPVPRSIVRSSSSLYILFCEGVGAKLTEEQSYSHSEPDYVSCCFDPFTLYWSAMWWFSSWLRRQLARSILSVLYVFEIILRAVKIYWRKMMTGRVGCWWRMSTVIFHYLLVHCCSFLSVLCVVFLLVFIVSFQYLILH